MNRRASLPGASELFRRTSNPVFGDGAVTPAGPPSPAPAPEAESVETATPDASSRAAEAPAPAEPAPADVAADTETAPEEPAGGTGSARQAELALETEPVPETEQARKTEQARNAKPARGTESAGENPAAGTAASEKAGPGGLAKASTKRRGSGRQKHDAKITVYLSGDELVAMEQARLALRASHALAVDRGRIVREAVAVLLADFEARGEDSVLVTRLRDGDLDDQEAAD